MWKFVIFFWFLCEVTFGDEVLNEDEDKFQSWVWDGHNFLYPILPIAAPWSKDAACRDDSRLLIKHLRNNTLWAMQMWDSSVKTPSGILYGSMYQLGNFDECLKIVSPVRAQYCLAIVHANHSQMPPETNPHELNFDPLSSVWAKLKNSAIDPSKVPRDTVQWGLCVPSSCSSQEIQNAINSYLYSINRQNSQKNDSTYSVEIHEGFCTKSNEENEFTLGEILFWTFTSILIFLTVTSTIADYLPQSSTKHGKCHTLWMNFSAKRNMKSIFESGRSEKRKPLDVLHGIKFASIIFVVLGHRVGIFLGLSAVNYQEVEELLRSEHNMFFVHSDLVVDTFFFISGLLVCYIFLPVFTKRFVNPFYAILGRLSRLAPAYFFVLWFQTSAVLRLGSGPLWNIIAKQENDFCVSNWWTNVLFINNYVNSDKICMPHSWFIPCDLHFFILSIPILLLLVKNKKIGVNFLIILTITSAVIPGIITYMNRLQPLVIFYFDFLAQPRNDNTFNVLYMRSHNRVTVYLIGMITGYFLHVVRNSEKRISKLSTLCGSLAWLAFMFAPMAYGSLYYDLERPYNVIEASFFASLRRVSWALGLSIFIISHRFGDIPLIGPIFSSRIATALSNITYGVYLIHFNLIMSHIEQTRSPRPFKIYDAILGGFEDLARSMFLATFLLLILEWPFKLIFRELLFSKKMDKPEKREENKQQYTINTISSILEMQSQSVTNYKL